MHFRAELHPPPFANKISIEDRLFLIGSCFTEEIGNKLSRSKFRVMQNPAGILFNPVSISETVQACSEDRDLTEDEIFYHQEQWHSWKHHSRFSNPDKETMLSRIREARGDARRFLEKADWVLITLGSAFVYETTDSTPGGGQRVVANCHKVPADIFRRRLLQKEEIADALKKIFSSARRLNPDVRFILTISPVRHLREGFVENNRSKALLIQAVHELVNADDINYFPSYELIIDDLRDYRFYAEDLAHPNYAATNYVWEKFMHACLSDNTKEIIKEVNVINSARSHKPFNPVSVAHKQFLQTHLQKLHALKNLFPWMDWDEEEAYFRAQ